MVIITDKLKKYVLSEDKKGYNQSEYDKRAEGYAKRGFEDLIFLLEKAPEYLQARIFTAGNLKRLFRAMFSTQLKSEMPDGKRIRMLELCNCALDEIRFHQNGPILAPGAWKVLRETESSSYHEAMYGSKVILAIQIESGVLMTNGYEKKEEVAKS